MKVQYWSVSALKRWDRENNVSTGEATKAGFYYQIDAEDAPIGPYATKNAALEAAREDA